MHKASRGECEWKGYKGKVGSGKGEVGRIASKARSEHGKMRGVSRAEHVEHVVIEPQLWLK